MGQDPRSGFQPDVRWQKAGSLCELVQGMNKVLPLDLYACIRMYERGLPHDAAFSPGCDAIHRFASEKGLH